MNTTVIKKAVALLIVLLLFGCSSSSKMEIESKIASELTVIYGDLKIIGEYKREIDGTMEYIIISPKEISTMKYTIDKSGCTISFKDMERTGEMWHNSPIKKVFEIINEAIYNPINVVDAKKGVTKGKIMTEKGKVLVTSKDKRIIKIEHPEFMAEMEYKKITDFVKPQNPLRL